MTAFGWLAVLLGLGGGDSPEIVPQNYVREQFCFVGCAVENIHVYDRRYRLYRKDSVGAFLSRRLPGRDVRWTEDFFDCNAIGLIVAAAVRRRFPGIPFGIAVVRRGAHVVNVMVDDDMTVWLYDGQTDVFTKAEEIEEVWIV